MRIEPVHPDDIDVGGNRRPLNHEKVGVLVTSIQQIGLRTPLTVLVPDDGSFIKLVTGHHRLAAVKKLGWDEVPCFLIENDQLDAEMWEIAENLHRAELTALERDEQVNRWIELEAAKREAEEEAEKLSQPVTVSKGGRGKEGGTRAAARELGINRMDAQRATKVAGLADEAKALAVEAGLDDNRSALLAATKETTPEAQTERLREIAQSKSDNTASDTKSRATAAAAEIIAAQVHPDDIDLLMANLRAAGCAHLATAVSKQKTVPPKANLQVLPGGKGIQPSSS